MTSNPIINVPIPILSVQTIYVSSHLSIQNGQLNGLNITTGDNTINNLYTNIDYVNNHMNVNRLIANNVSVSTNTYEDL